MLKSSGWKLSNWIRHKYSKNITTRFGNSPKKIPSLSYLQEWIEYNSKTKDQKNSNTLYTNLYPQCSFRCTITKRLATEKLDTKGSETKGPTTKWPDKYWPGTKGITCFFLNNESTCQSRNFETKEHQINRPIRI